MDGTLQGKIALVTGGASGIGQAAAIAFARAGAKVVVADVSVDGGEKTVQEIRSAGGEARFVPCDVGRADQVEAMVESALSAYGRLDCAFNNAGIEGVEARTADVSEADWDRVQAINLKGVWLCMKYELLQMRSQRSGAIVNTASVNGLVGWAGAAAYSAAKHGVVGLTKTAALEYARAGIRVNAVCPGIVKTGMSERLFQRHPELEEKMVRLTPIRRAADSAEIAEAVLWLCSDAASFVTGVALPVDGGLVAH